MQIENREEAQRSILQMCRGAFQERVDYEMPHLMENIFDPNTAAKAKRKVTITLELCPRRHPPEHRGQLLGQDDAGPVQPRYHDAVRRGRAYGGGDGAADSRPDCR